MLVDGPMFDPSVCLGCRGATGPVVDTLAETLEGRVYLCVQCVSEAASLLGMADAERVAYWEATLAKHGQRERELEAELERERANKTVPMREVMEAIRRTPDVDGVVLTATKTKPTKKEKAHG